MGPDSASVGCAVKGATRASSLYSRDPSDPSTRMLRPFMIACAGCERSAREMSAVCLPVGRAAGRGAGRADRIVGSSKSRRSVDAITSPRDVSLHEQTAAPRDVEVRVDNDPRA